MALNTAWSGYHGLAFAGAEEVGAILLLDAPVVVLEVLEDVVEATGSVTNLT